MSSENPISSIRSASSRIKKETLDKGWNYLISTYPTFKDNKYLKNSGKKNKYFSLITKSTNYMNANIFGFLYKNGLMK